MDKSKHPEIKFHPASEFDPIIPDHVVSDIAGQLQQKIEHEMYSAMMDSCFTGSAAVDSLTTTKANSSLTLESLQKIINSVPRMPELYGSPLAQERLAKVIAARSGQRSYIATLYGIPIETNHNLPPNMLVAKSYDADGKPRIQIFKFDQI
jgi:hypothetical protein